MVESLLTSDPPLIREACCRMQGWYKEVINHTLPHIRITSYRMPEERVALYMRVIMIGKNVPMEVAPLTINNSVPHGDKVAWEIQHLIQQPVGGP